MLELSTNITLLVIEDNPGDFYLVEEFLIEKIPNCRIEHCNSFKESHEKLNNGLKPDAILLDLTLPDANGEDLVKKMIDLAGSVPIIVLTGYSDKEFSIKSLLLGISDYLLKDDLSSTQLAKSIFYSIERKKINYKLKKSEEKYRHLFDGNPVPMWVYDLDTYKFLNINPAAETHYGYSREEFLAMTIRDIRPPEDIPRFEEAVKSNENHTKSGKSVFRHTKKNGQIFYVEIQSNDILFENRKARLVLATDVSDRMKYIHEIEEQNRVMRDIAWTQSHVVRAPIARIIGLINIFPTLDDREELGKVLNYILNSTHELDSLIREIVRKTEKIDPNKYQDGT